jgi:hypothetical protein
VINMIEVIIEGSSHSLEDRDYTGAELRQLGGLGPRDKLVKEEAEGSETPIPPSQNVRPRDKDNFFASVRHRRGRHG